MVLGQAGGMFGLCLFFASVLLGVIPTMAGLTVFVLGLPPEQGRELVHVALAFFYGSWLTLPLLGYRVNEGADVSRLFIFPVSRFTLFFSSYLSSLLDPSGLLLLPPLATLALLHGGGPWGVIAPLLVVAVFLLHTVATGQFILFALRHLLQHRRFWDFVIMAVPLFLIFSIWGGQAFFMAADTGELTVGSLLEIPFSSVLGYFPPGIAAEALLNLRAGNLVDAAYWMFTLVFMTAVSIVVFAFISNRILMGHYDASVRRARIRQSSGDPSWLSTHLNWRGLKCGPVLAQAIKEAKLVIREPQCRMIFGMYFTLLALTSIICFVVPEVADKMRLLLHGILFGSVFFFSGLFFNTVAIERTGLKLNLTMPVTPIEIFAGKNLGTGGLVALCFIVASVFVGIVAGEGSRMPLFAVWPDLGARILMLERFLFFVLIIILSGLGNMLSVLCPLPLPSGGLAQRKPLGIGKVFLMSVGTFAALSMGGCLATPVMGLLVFVTVFPSPLIAGMLAPAGILYVAGIWALSTVAAGRILEWRRAQLLTEILD